MGCRYHAGTAAEDRCTLAFSDLAPGVRQLPVTDALEEANDGETSSE